MTAPTGPFVVGQIQRADSQDGYPLADVNQLLGGVKDVATAAALPALTNLRPMNLAIAEDTGIIYQYVSGSYVPLPASSLPNVGTGTVSSVSVTTANGVSGTVANPTTTPAISLTLGAITPTSVAASGTVTGSNLSGTNTGNVTLGTANGLSLVGQALSLATVTSGTAGAAPASGGGTTNYLRADGTWAAPAGVGTVTSVGLTTPPWLTVAGSPVTGSGTLAVTATTGEPANEFLATPNGTTGAVGLRAIVAADVPTLNQNTTGSAASFTGSLTGDVTGTQGATVIGVNSVGFNKLAQVGAHSYLGNNTGSTANAAAITNTQLTADLNLFSSSLQGLTPSSGGGTTNYLRADGTWAAPAGSGSVTSVAASGGVETTTGSPITSSGTIRGSFPINAQTGNNYTFHASDRGAHFTFSNLSTIALSLPQAGTTGFENGYYVIMEDIGVGAMTITPTTSTINGATTATLTTGMKGLLLSDGTNYRLIVINPQGIPVNAQTGTSYGFVNGDAGSLVTFSNASAIAATLSVATNLDFNKFWCWVENRGAGTLTITPTTSTIDGAATLALTTNQGCMIASDGTNYFTMRGAAFGLSIASGKTLTVSNTLTLAGTDSTTMTFPPASANIGYLEVPSNTQSAAYTTVLADSGKCIVHPASDTNARTFTIDSHTNVAWVDGACISFENWTSQVVTIAITTDTMYLAGTGTTGSRSLAQYGIATARYTLATNSWLISGTGLT